MERKAIINKFKQTHNLEQFLGLLYDMKVDEMGQSAKPFIGAEVKKLMWPKNRKRYKIFKIPKKSGGVRQIAAPYPKLKSLLYYLKQFLDAFYNPMPCVQGFAQGRSVVGNAGMHLYQNYIYNVDLSDFFPSITYGRIWKRLQLPPYNFPEPLCRIIASLGCIHYPEKGEGYNALPQGAPTSPILSNMICEQMDRRLSGLAKRFGLHYSRYADDMTFSSMHNVYADGSEFLEELKRIVTEQGFSFNDKKTRLQKRGSCQEVTGLKVGVKTNVSRKYIKELRSVLHVWEKFSYADAYAWFYSRYKGDKGHSKKGEPVLENVIEGKLNYLKMVKGGCDSTYKSLRNRFDVLLSLLTEQRPKHSNRFVVVSYPISEFKKLFSGVLMEFKTTPKGYVSGKMISENVVTPIYFDKIFRDSDSNEKEAVLSSINNGTSKWWISEVEDTDRHHKHRFNHFWQISKYEPKKVSPQSYIEELLNIWEKDGLNVAVRMWKNNKQKEPPEKPRSKEINKPDKVKSIKKILESDSSQTPSIIDEGINPADFDAIKSEIEAIKKEIKNEKANSGLSYDIMWDDIPFLESGEPLDVVE